METPIEPEKLNIVPENIIPILLKHLMLLKNELAYIKKLGRLNSLPEGIHKKSNGGNSLPSSVAKIDNGGNFLQASDAKIDNGGNSLQASDAKIDSGGNSLQSSDAKISNGGNSFQSSVAKIDDGGNSVFYAIEEVEDIANVKELVYALFEQGLMEALDNYVKNDNDEYSLYQYYADFVQTINDKNLAHEKMMNAQKSQALEDTHILPRQIPYENDSLTKLINVLRNYLPHNTTGNMYQHLSEELILLYNHGTATSSNLRVYSGLSKDGFEKHLTNLKRKNFIKKHSPGKYELTDFSKHILLQVFGVKKGEEN